MVIADIANKVNKKIQEDVTKNKPNMMATEVWVTKEDGSKGRIDLLNVDTGEAYEIKPLGDTETKQKKYDKEADKQLKSYINGTLPAIHINVSKVAGITLREGREIFSGKIPDEEINTDIYYGSNGNGQIRYLLWPKNKPLVVPERAKSWEAEPQRNPQPSIGDAIIAVAVGLCEVIGNLPIPCF